MKLLGKQLLREFVQRHPDAQSQIDSWEAEVEDADWDTPHILKERYPKASILPGQHIVFNICRNKYRLWVRFSFKNQIVVVMKIGTHKEYEKWNIG